MEKDGELIDFVNEVLKPNLEELAGIRSEIKKEGNKNRLILCVIVILGLIYAYFDVQEEMGYVFMADISFVGFGVLLIVLLGLSKAHSFVGKPKVNKFNSKFKHDIVGATIKFIHPYLHYKPIFKTSKQQLKKSGLFNPFTEYKEDDGITGDFENVKVCLSEIHIMNGFKKTFDGLMVRLKFGTELKEDKLIEIINQMKSDLGLSIRVAMVNGSLNFGVESESSLFEVSLSKSNDEEVIRNIEFLYNVFSYINDLQVCQTGKSLNR